MKIFFKVLSILFVCALISAQEREGSDDSDRQLVQQFKRPSILDPIRKIGGGIRDRVREGSSLVVNRIQGVIAGVRRRTEQLEEDLNKNLDRLRPQAVEARKRLKALEEQKKQLTEKIKVVNNEFEEKKNEYRSALKEQKDVIDNQIQSTQVKDPNVGTELKKESEILNTKIKEVDDLVLVPEPRGLGDGYGRHLK